MQISIEVILLQLFQNLLTACLWSSKNFLGFRRHAQKIQLNQSFLLHCLSKQNEYTG